MMDNEELRLTPEEIREILATWYATRGESLYGLVKRYADAHIAKALKPRLESHELREKIKQILEEHFHRELYYDPVEPIIDQILATFPDRRSQA